MVSDTGVTPVSDTIFSRRANNPIAQKNIPVTEATGISPLPDNLFGHPITEIVVCSSFIFDNSVVAALQFVVCLPPIL